MYSKTRFGVRGGDHLRLVNMSWLKPRKRKPKTCPTPDISVKVKLVLRVSFSWFPVVEVDTP